MLTDPRCDGFSWHGFKPGLTTVLCILFWRFGYFKNNEKSWFNIISFIMLLLFCWKVKGGGFESGWDFRLIFFFFFLLKNESNAAKMATDTDGWQIKEVILCPFPSLIFSFLWSICKHMHVFMVKKHLVTAVQAIDAAPLSHSAWNGLFCFLSSDWLTEWHMPRPTTGNRL